MWSGFFGSEIDVRSDAAAPDAGTFSSDPAGRLGGNKERQLVGDNGGHWETNRRQSEEWATSDKLVEKRGMVENRGIVDSK